MQKNEQKMTEQQFLRILTSSVCGIVLCLVCLVSTTWAWYSMDIVCTNNVIEVGLFGADITVLWEDVPVEPDDSLLYDLDEREEGEYVYSLDPGEYEIQIAVRFDNTSPGYCIIRIDGEQMGQTIALYPEGNEMGLPSFAGFNLILQQPATVELIPIMGKPIVDMPVSDGEIFEPTIPEEEEFVDLEEPVLPPEPSEEVTGNE